MWVIAPGHPAQAMAERVSILTNVRGSLGEGWSRGWFGKIQGNGQDIHVTSEERLARGSKYPDMDKMAMPRRKSDKADVPSGFTVISAASSALNSASIG